MEDIRDINWPLLILIALTGVGVGMLVPDSARGTVFAATVALTLGFIAYPWQKSKDRDLEIEKEKRFAIANFISSTESHFAHYKVSTPVGVEDLNLGAADDEFKDIETKRALLQVYCEPATQTLAEDYQRSLKQLWNSLKDEKLKRGFEPGKKIKTKEYSAACDVRSEKYRTMSKKRTDFYLALRTEISGRIEPPQLDQEI